MSYNIEIHKINTLKLIWKINYFKSLGKKGGKTLKYIKYLQ